MRLADLLESIVYTDWCALPSETRTFMQGFLYINVYTKNGVVIRQTVGAAAYAETKKHQNDVRAKELIKSSIKVYLENWLVGKQHFKGFKGHHKIDHYEPITT